ncbi:asmA family protein [bacterium BMS3Abin10]|nr:asmA family protein [bacterium BMS3Abin10]GBE39527.1 asmA family protein [bacterium BMS3Bbin08]HDK16480.1 AsmA family protein [Nitrospirota bacterium]
MKTIVKIVIALLIIVVILFVSKNFIAKAAVTGGVKAVTGLEMDIKSMDVGILKTLVGINSMKLYNPPGYTDRVMIDMPEIYIDYDLAAFLKRKAHLEEIRINLKELTVIKDRDGKLNLDALKVVEEEKEAAKTEKKEKIEMQIDELDLKIGKVIYKDFSKGKEPKIREYNINLHEKFHNITDLKDLGKIILVKALLNTGIAGLANFDLGSLKSGISDTLKGTAGAVGDIGKKAADTIEKTTKGITDKIKLPFGD